MSLMTWARAIEGFPVASDGTALRLAKREARLMEISLRVPGSGILPRVRIEHRGRKLSVSWVLFAQCSVDTTGGPDRLIEDIATAQRAWAEFIAASPHLPGATASWQTAADYRTPD